MDMKKIDDNQIEIVITADDLAQESLNVQEILTNSQLAQTFFQSIMLRAEADLGFQVHNAQLCIEATPAEDNSFILTVTRVDSDDGFESLEKTIKQKLTRKEMRAKRRSKQVLTDVWLIAFRSFDQLLDAASVIGPVYDGDSTLFRVKETYYLAISKQAFTITQTQAECILSEFSESIQQQVFFEGYLNEYGERLMDPDAVRQLYSASHLR